MIVEMLRQRVRTRVSGLLGDLGLFDAALNALEKQSRVTKWVLEVFTNKEANDTLERSLRTAEEGLELAQACGADAATLHRLVDYVMSRPVGKPEQEIAGCMVTLYAMAAALKVDADMAFEVELERIAQPEIIDRCRRRQHEKREALAPNKAKTFRCTQCGELRVVLTPNNLCADCSKKCRGCGKLSETLLEGVCAGCILKATATLTDGLAVEGKLWTVIGLYERGKYVRDVFTCYASGVSAKEAKDLAIRSNAERGDKIEVLACVAGGHVAHVFERGVTTEPTELKSRLERAEVQLAACGVAALDGSVEQEAKVGDYGWSASYMEVLKIRRELETLRAKFAAPALTSSQTDAVRYALRDAFEQQIDRCGGVVPVRSLPDETVSEVFLKALAERGQSIVDSIAVQLKDSLSETSPLEDFCDAQLGRTGALE